MAAGESPRAARLRNIVLAVAAVAYLSSVLFSETLSRNAEGIATLWTANGVLAAALMHIRGRRAALLVAICGLAHVAIDRMVGDSWFLAVGASVLDMAEAGGAAAVAWRIFRPRGQVRSISQVFILIASMAPLVALTAGVSALGIGLTEGKPFIDSWLAWFMANWLGMALILPSCLVLLDASHLRHFDRHGAEQFGIYALIAAITWITFGPTPLQTPFLIFPALILAAVRLGPRGAALGALLVGSVAGPITLAGAGPTNLNGQWDPSARMHVLELFCATLFVTGLALALAIEHQGRMKQLLERRSRTAHAARARALRASQAKTDFLAVMSHEIRTPLNSVLGFTRLLLDRHDLPGEAERQLRMVDRAGESLLTVVNDILDFSRIEAGKIELEARPTDLAALVRDTAEIVAADAAHKALGLEIVIDAAPGRHLVDDHRLRQVLLNLLNNAIKFTPKGGVTAALTVSPDGDLDRVRLEVRDSGIGIAPDKIRRLFSPFSQADGSVSRTYGGAGLGLAICRALIEGMGGRIGVDSVAGHGSVFWIDLSLTPVAADIDAAQTEAAPPQTARILLVDDHAMNRELGVALLTLAGCEVETAEDGQQAVDAASSRDFDVVLMDVHMPGMDGLEATRLIRALPGRAGRVPIIALSADALPQHVERCKKAGMVDHVAKPIRRETLYAALERWLGAADLPGETREVA